MSRVGGTAVEGAFVLLVDARGAEVARVLTAADGQFAIRAPVPGMYQLISRRVGFRPSPPALLTLGREVAIDHRLALEPIPVSLAAVVVEEEGQCDMQAERRGPALAALWEEISEALAAVVWSSREPGYWFTYTTFERELTTGGRVVREADLTREGFYQRPFGSAPARDLAARGYVIPDGDGWTFFAPDAEVLLSNEFLRSHCFDVEIGRADSGLLGLSFSPLPRNELPDITGTLWVDGESNELRYLAYDYARLPGSLTNYTGGGQLDFKRVPSGAWIVSDWVIRMPHGMRAAGRASVGTREVGGQVDVIKRRQDGMAIYSRVVAQADGIVFDSIRGIADSVPADRLCPDTDVLASALGVVGTVREVPSQRAAAGAEIIITWQDVLAVPGRIGARDLRATSRAGEDGRFALCGLPSDKTMTLGANLQGREGKPIHLRFADGGVHLSDGAFRSLQGRIWRQDLEVREAAAPSAVAPPTVTDSSRVEAASATLRAVGFDDRRRMGAGRFVTREEFLRWSPTAITAVLVRIPGLVATVRGGRRIIDVRRGRTSVRFSCTPLVLLDNQPLGMSGELDLDASIPLEHVAAIEVYRGPAEVPAQFGGTNTACGLIAVWTR